MIFFLSCRYFSFNRLLSANRKYRHHRDHRWNQAAMRLRYNRWWFTEHQPGGTRKCSTVRTFLPLNYSTIGTGYRRRQRCIALFKDNWEPKEEYLGNMMLKTIVELYSPPQKELFTFRTRSTFSSLQICCHFFDNSNFVRSCVSETFACMEQSVTHWFVKLITSEYQVEQDLIIMTYS